MNVNVNAEMQTLEALVGEHPAVKVVVEGKEHTVAIKQIKTGKIPKLLRACGPLIPMLTGAEKLDVNRLVMLHSEDALNMLAVLIERPREFVDELDIDDAVRLLGAAFEANVDFFVQRVLPLMSKSALKLVAELQSKKETLEKLAGLKPPSTSSLPDTESATSGSTATANSSST